MEYVIADQFRQHLQLELVNRTQKNPRYSLRAFAKHLGIHHASLSGMLNGKRDISKRYLFQFSEALGLGPDEVKKFLTVDPNSLKHPPQDAIELDTFNYVSDWYHDAILELTHVKNFTPNTKWIAKVLSVSVAEVNAAVDRLQRLDLLEIDAIGNWKDLSEHNTICPTLFTNTAYRKYQKQIIEKAAAVVDSVEFSQRSQSSVTMAVAKEDLDHAKELIKKFRRDMIALMQREGTNPDEVYQLSVSFFPLSETNREQGVIQ